MLFNRQPTLHKPSLMSHIARVLPKEQTIRMHYANCSSYNADFDGDEMNLHFLQNHLARIEGYNLSLNDKIYINPTSKDPIRGLIQDSVLSAVYVSMKDSFFEKSEYNQLLYCSIRTLFDNKLHFEKIKLVHPAIIKPKVLWTGKQIVSTIIKLIANFNFKDEVESQKEKLGLYHQYKCRVPDQYFSAIDTEEKTVTIVDNELLTGIIDKSSIGASAFGMIHTFSESFIQIIQVWLQLQPQT